MLILKFKKHIIWTVCLSLMIVLVGYYFPKQHCLINISAYGDSYLYPYNDSSDYEKRDVAKRFKTRNDALDFCMAQRWNFSNNNQISVKEDYAIFDNNLTPEQENLRAKRLQEMRGDSYDREYWDKQIREFELGTTILN